MINILKLNENEKKFLNIFHDVLYKIDNKYDENINLYLDSIFYLLLNSFDTKFEEKLIKYV